MLEYFLNPFVFVNVGYMVTALIIAIIFKSKNIFFSPLQIVLNALIIVLILSIILELIF